MSRGTWTGSQLSELKSMWKDGSTAKEIGEKIGKTRSSVLAKINRLGLARKITHLRPAPQKTVNKNPVYKPNKERKTIAETCYGEKTALSDLDRKQCCWPVGDPKSPDFGFCGAIKERLSEKYCDKHKSIAHQKARAPIRAHYD